MRGGYVVNCPVLGTLPWLLSARVTHLEAPARACPQVEAQRKEPSGQSPPEPQLSPGPCFQPQLCLSLRFPFPLGGKTSSWRQSSSCLRLRSSRNMVS